MRIEFVSWLSPFVLTAFLITKQYKVRMDNLLNARVLAEAHFVSGDELRKNLPNETQLDLWVIRLPFKYA